MKTLLAGVVLSVALIGSAFAGEITGLVVEVDLTARTIKLTDDTVVKAAADLDLETVKPFQKVVITTDDANVATKVVLAQ